MLSQLNQLVLYGNQVFNKWYLNASLSWINLIFDLTTISLLIILSKYLNRTL